MFPRGVFNSGFGGGFEDGQSPYESRSRADYPSSYSDDFYGSPQKKQEAQEKERREYEQRVRELGMLCLSRTPVQVLIFYVEEEIKREKAEEARKARERKATVQDRVQACDRAFAAARCGDLDELQGILDKYGIMPTTTSGKNKHETLILAGARSGNISLVDWLFKHGAQLDVVNKDGLNAFHIAVSLGHSPLVQHLVEKHPKDFHPSKALPDGRTPLLLAVRSGSAEAVRVLIRYAPTHDVGRCWAEVDSALSKVNHESDKKKWRTILDVLRTKVCNLLCTRGFLLLKVTIQKGFVPPGEESDRDEVPTPTAEERPAFGEGQSKKAIKRRRQRERYPLLNFSVFSADTCFQRDSRGCRSRAAQARRTRGHPGRSTGSDRRESAQTSGTC